MTFTVRDEPTLDEPSYRPPAFSEDALALEFAERYADDLRYVAEWSKWFRWDGKRWAPDKTRHIFDLARKICRKSAAQCNDKSNKGLASAKAVAAVERLAQCDRQLAATIDQWDADPWLLNTPGGVVDLKTGRVRHASPTDFMTKITAAAPGGPCPIWRKFLQRVTDGDEQLISYLQRVTGYALTGLTIEHVLLFLYGNGGNGKSKFIEAVSGMLGDYHTTASTETFTASHSDRHPTELANLRGARLVTAIETEANRQWAEAKIKALTGGDRISARFMRQDFFEYTPQFLLMIAGNHKPGLRAVDEAMRRRLHLVPFTVKITQEERDGELGEKLKTEWPGILQWAIEGCLQWRKIGLAPPAAVLAATAEYLDSEDALVAWIEECCQPDLEAFETRSALYSSFKDWAQQSNEPASSAKRFYASLEARSGIEAAQKRFDPKVERGFRGLKLRGSEWPQTA
jgi:putative DNA primase/helicase